MERRSNTFKVYTRVGPVEPMKNIAGSIEAEAAWRVVVTWSLERLVCGLFWDTFQAYSGIQGEFSTHSKCMARAPGHCHRLWRPPREPRTPGSSPTGTHGHPRRSNPQSHSSTHPGNKSVFRVDKAMNSNLNRGLCRRRRSWCEGGWDGRRGGGRGCVRFWSSFTWSNLKYAY